MSHGYYFLCVIIPRRPECADRAWVDAERKSFDWHFFSAFLGELDRLNNLEMVARQREESLRLAVPKDSQGVYRASPLQILNQLVVQKHIAFSDATGGGGSAEKLQVGTGQTKVRPRGDI